MVGGYASSIQRLNIEPARGSRFIEEFQAALLSVERPSGATTTIPSGHHTHRSETKRQSKRGRRLSNLRAPRPPRLLNPEPRTIKTKPANSRYE